MDKTQGPDIASSVPAYLTGWRLYTVIACLFFGQFLTALDTNIITVALPRISSDFGSLDSVAWYSTGYILCLTAFQPLFGSIYKFFRTDVVYRVTIFIFEVGSILSAAATSSTMFIIGRSIAGLGAAGVLQGALSIISQTVELEKRPVYTSAVISVFLIAATAGPVLGGVFTQHATWRWCFWINLPIGGLVLIGLTLFLKIPGAPNQHRALPLKTKLKNMDLLGALVFVGAACCLLLALQWGGQTKPWDSADVIGCLVGTVVLGVLFLYWQWRRKENALITPRVFMQRSIWTASGVLFFLGAQGYSVVFFLAFWFQGVKGISPVDTGVDFIARLIPQFACLIITSLVVKKFGHYVPYMLLGELICIGGQVMLTQLQPTSNTVYWAASLVVTGLGSGMAMQLPYTAIPLVLSDEDIPVGNAIAVFFYQMGGAISISLGQTITLSTLIDLVPERLPDVPLQSVVDAGAANLDSLGLSSSGLSILQDIWNIAIVRTMILATAVVGAAVPFTLGMEWLNANKIAAERKETAARVKGEETEDSIRLKSEP